MKRINLPICMCLRVYVLRGNHRGETLQPIDFELNTADFDTSWNPKLFLNTCSSAARGNLTFDQSTIVKESDMQDSYTASP